MPEDHQALMTARADVEDPTRSLVAITGRADEVRRAIKEVLSNLGKEALVIEYAETLIDRR